MIRPMINDLIRSSSVSGASAYQYYTDDAKANQLYSDDAQTQKFTTGD